MNDLAALSLTGRTQTLEPSSFSANSASAESTKEAELREAAKDFEAAFIGQMLKFSGLGDALVKGGGEDVAAFTDFYIEKFAEELSDNGGLGLQDKFYQKLKMQNAMMNKTGNLDVKS
ncbi:rod-binding protein [Litorimonas sp.]|jgi:Rod binding domain-containing protein|uniref:rod-binding protein n=1 Tax=Litorimonas sp. TaxID=1892381 RepID=UPI003A890226